ncbi:MAG: VPDSG-CTERM sorting domain-containing protein [Chthoniobacterales bacterium]
MKTLILAAIRCSLMFTAVTASLFSVRPAQAYTVTLEQVGSNVVATGGGALDLTGLTFEQNFLNAPPQIQANFSLMITGPGGANQSQYVGFTGPTNFGSGDLVFADTGSGDGVGIFGTSIIVPQGYISGAALSSSATFNNATLASLGATPGFYSWTWGDGENQFFALEIGSVGVPGVPDGGSTVSLLGCTLLGVAALRRKLKLLRPIS